MHGAVHPTLRPYAPMLTTRTIRTTIAATALLAVSAVAPAGAQPTPPAGEWPHYAGSTYGHKYSALDQITPDNVGRLRVAWRKPSPDRAFADDPVRRRSRNEDTPLMVNGQLYHVTGLGIVMALDPATGETRWTYDPQSHAVGRPNNGGFLTRGMGYWTDGEAERLLVGTHDAYLLSIDARTGRPDPAFGDNGRADLAAGIRHIVRSTNWSARQPLVAGDVVVVGNSISDGGRGRIGDPRTREVPPGDVQAFDVRTGRKLWTFHTIPKEYEAGYDTWLDGSADQTGAANVWAVMAYDPELDYVYMASSSATNDTYGGDRLGDNLFAESLICVESRTGERVWHFQAIHHGLWDYDLPAMPVLGDITVDGRRIRAVMQVSKQAFTYVLDRATGEPVWPLEERAVPASTVPGERAAPTQPFPTRPPPFDLQGAVEENLIDFTPELRARARAQLEQFVHGPLFTPPTPEGTLTLPGTLGGANWGGAGFDPETGILYVGSRTHAELLSVFPPGARPARPDREALTVDGLPLFKPPWTRVTAIDVNRGEHLWQRPLGNGPRNHPLLRDLDLPPLGDHIDGDSVLVTKTLLFVTTYRRDRRTGNEPMVPVWDPWGDPDAVRKLVYVFDKRTGDLLRTIDLDGASVAAPMTYLHAGTQYIVMAAGGNEALELVALALPD